MRRNRRVNRIDHCRHSQRCSCRLINGSGKIFTPVDYVDKGSLSCRVSKTMTQVLRHQGSHREDDGAMDWNTLLHVLCRDCENAPKWTNPEWFDLLHKGSGKDRFQYCQNSDGFIHYMRAIQGHSGGNNVESIIACTFLINTQHSDLFFTLCTATKTLVWPFYRTVSAHRTNISRQEVSSTRHRQRCTTSPERAEDAEERACLTSGCVENELEVWTVRHEHELMELSATVCRSLLQLQLDANSICADSLNYCKQSHSRISDTQ